MDERDRTVERYGLRIVRLSLDDLAPLTGLIPAFGARRILDPARPARASGASDAAAREDAITRVQTATREIARRTADQWAAVLEVLDDAERRPEVWIDPLVQCTDTEAREYAGRAAVADLAVRIHASETAVRSMGEHARRLSRCLDLWAAFREGSVSPQVARIAAETLGAIPVEQWPLFGTEILDAATSLAPGRFRTIAHRVRDRIHRISVEARHAEAATGRRVSLEHDLDGMSWLTLHLPSAAAVEAFERIDAAARDLTGMRGETRTLDQARADVAVDLLTGSGPSEGGRVELTVTIPASTLLGGTEPGILDGVGPITAQTARDLAGRASSFARALTDPDGRILRVDPHHYRIPAALQRRIRTRDVICRFPGCSRRARRCDIDHIHERQHGGSTTPGNLMCLCRHHHRIKTLTRWDPSPPDAAARIAWTSPTGVHTDTDPPPF